MKIAEKTAWLLSLTTLLFAAASVAQARGVSHGSGGMSRPAYNRPAKLSSGSNLATAYGKLPSGMQQQNTPTGTTKLSSMYSKFPPGTYKPIAFPPTTAKLPPVWSKFPPGSFKPIAFGPVKTPPTKTPPTRNHPTGGWGYGGGFGAFGGGLGGFGGGSGGNSGSDDTASNDSVASPAVATVASADDPTTTADSSQPVTAADASNIAAPVTQPTMAPAVIASAQ